MSKIWFGLLLAVGLLLVMAGSVILGILPQIIKDKVKEEIPFNDNTSEAFERWQKTPVPLYMKFTFFVCKNADTYTNLSDIELEERGPYVYEETRLKQNITFYDDEVSYLENKTYKFRPDMSGHDIWINDPFARHCNKLKGTDGQLFKPNLEKEDTIYAFEPQLCRSVYFKYWKESEVQDIDTYRFRVPQEYFQCPLVNEDNTCYCNRNVSLCNRNGMIEIAHCQYRSLGAPIMMSSPYWNNGDPTLRTQFKSELKPPKELNDDNYGTYLDIEPTAEADDDQADKWKSMVGNKVKLGKGLSIAAITVGGLMAIIAIFLIYKYR
ncbi:unnamed protein product [Medioppia subpectinata]|uniref:Uncharacterized protein n=1 Tax=Medioppia subpectinata TaxID=1979941 RepID=A0A7R9Q2U1_9ACAR|nr:unnamed protein product [Medioppia subpectinata]CAG2110749.1 unnamed protein product [Medioppia subpectinata]